MKMKEKLVVIGNGMAAMRTVEEILKIDADMYEISVFGAEPYGNYNRIMLSPLLAGEKTLEQIMLNDEQWYIDNGIKLHKGCKVSQIDRIKRKVVADNGVEAPYDRLLIATGSEPIMIPVPGHGLEGVISFRDMQDVDAMLLAARQYKKAVVIGGGLLGLEAANGLLQQGMQVTVVHLMDRLMERQLDLPAATMLQESLQQKGIEFLMQAQTDSIVGDNRVEKVRFKDGSEIEADLVVMAVGIRPNIELAKASGIYCQRGIVVNDTLQTY